jgi:ribonuclease HI
MPNLVIHTDGGSRGNPGPAATGVVMLIDGEVVQECSTFLGQQTNNEAEYRAVLDALDALPQILQKHQISAVEWKLDSMLVVQQLSRVWKIKEPRMAVFAKDIWQKLSQLAIPYTFSYVPRAENSQADALVNKTLDAQN